MADPGERSGYHLPDGVVIAVVGVILLVWAAGQLAPIWVEGFVLSPEVNFGVFGILASIFGKQFFHRGGS